LAALPLAIDLYQPARFDLGEERSVNTAIETWQRKSSFAPTKALELDHWLPVYLGRLRPEQPPGATWLHVIAMPDLDHATSLTTAATSRARLMSLFMALILVGAVFWAGYSINGLPTALFSALVALSMPALIFFGRLATADVPIAAWTTLAIAASLWAMRPLRHNPSLVRQFVGWLVCGLAIGMTVLTGGPVALPTVILPIIVIALICPHRLGHAMGVAAAFALAVLLVTPWAIQIHEAIPQAWQEWTGNINPADARGGWGPYFKAVVWRLSAVIAIGGLWVVWLIPALIQPFSSSTREARPRMMLGWAWFVTAAILMAFSPARPSLRALLVVVPAASIIIGQVMRQYTDQCAEGRQANLWRANRWLMVGLTGSLALALPAWGYFRWTMPQTLERIAPWQGQLFAPMSPWYWLGMALVLMLAAGLGLRFSRKNHPARAVGAWAAWMVIAASVLAIPMSRGAALSTPVQHTQSLE